MEDTLPTSASWLPLISYPTLRVHSNKYRQRSGNILEMLYPCYSSLKLSSDLQELICKRRLVIFYCSEKGNVYGYGYAYNFDRQPTPCTRVSEQLM